MPVERYIEATILEFHTRRRHLAECMQYAFEAAQLWESKDIPPLYVRLEMFVRQQLLPPPKGGGLSLAIRIFQEIHNLGNVLAKAQAAKQNAKSNTVVPSQSEYAPLPSECVICGVSF